MKSPVRTFLRPFLLPAAALLAGFRPLAARADIAAPPNDYTGFLYDGGYYFTPWAWIVVLCLCLPVGACLWRNRFFRQGIRSWRSIVAAALCEVLLLAGVVTVGGNYVRESFLLGRREPGLVYLDNPTLRAKYDQKCIDWYNAHRGDWPGEHSYIYWRNVPRMRPGAPEAVTNAYEAFRKSLRSERDMPHGRDMWNAGESIAGGE